MRQTGLRLAWHSQDNVAFNAEVEILLLNRLEPSLRISRNIVLKQRFTLFRALCRVVNGERI